MGFLRNLVKAVDKVLLTAKSSHRANFLDSFRDNLGSLAIGFREGRIACSERGG